MLIPAVRVNKSSRKSKRDCVSDFIQAGLLPRAGPDPHEEELCADNAELKSLAMNTYCLFMGATQDEQTKKDINQARRLDLAPLGL